MALPVLKSLEDCGDFSKTVEPFIPQLYALPGQLRDAITSPEQLKLVYLTTNPLISGFAASLVFGAIFLVVSEANRNYSQVDRMWSILPNLYVCHLAVWARLAGLNHSRIDLIAVFTTIWSVSICCSCSSHLFEATLMLVEGSSDVQLLASWWLPGWV